MTMWDNPPLPIQSNSPNRVITLRPERGNWGAKCDLSSGQTLKSLVPNRLVRYQFGQSSTCHRRVRSEHGYSVKITTAVRPLRQTSCAANSDESTMRKKSVTIVRDEVRREVNDGD